MKRDELERADPKSHSSIALWPSVPVPPAQLVIFILGACGPTWHVLGHLLPAASTSVTAPIGADQADRQGMATGSSCDGCRLPALAIATATTAFLLSDHDAIVPWAVLPPNKQDVIHTKPPDSHSPPRTAFGMWESPAPDFNTPSDAELAKQHLWSKPPTSSLALLNKIYSQPIRVDLNHASILGERSITLNLSCVM